MSVESPRHRADWTVWQRPATAQDFAGRRARIPSTDLQLDVLRRLIGCLRPGALRVLDLGCGDGFLLDQVLRLRPGSCGVGLDGSPAMLEQARARFAHRSPPVTLVEADFNDTESWPARLPPGEPFDVVSSAFAIHHSEDPQKRAIYMRVFQLLVPGGLFVNIEHVASATALGGQLFESMYVDFVVADQRAHGRDADHAAILQSYRTGPEKAANRLTAPELQLRWLREIGFVDVDCYFRYLELAVLAGYRPRC